MDKKKSTMATPTLETFADQTQVFASAWSLINRQFGGEDSLERAEVERGILLDMARRLIEDHDAARQEIASLRAQPYDQQAMGLCHVCGWKGVIDYPDGPVCVACEHDKALSLQPTAQALDKDEAKAKRLTEKRWLDVSFISEGDMAAREQEDVGGWRRAGALLYRLTGEHRPTNFDEIRVTMANGSRDIGQMSAQAERLLVMLTAPQPAPGVETVSEREFKQFLSDVLTAAGLVTHGKKCKDLGRRLGEMSMRLLTAPKTAAAPVQAGEYPDLPDLYSTGAPFWRAVLAWHDAHHGLEATNAADKLEMLVADMLRAYVDADRAARAAAQAAPVDAAVKPAINVGTIGHVGSGRTTLTAALGKLIAAQKGNYD